MPGVDCLWVGHFDLSASLGIPGQFEHPTSCRRSPAWRRPARAWKGLGRLVPDAATGIDYSARGFDFLCWSGRRMGAAGRRPRRHRRDAGGHRVAAADAKSSGGPDRWRVPGGPQQRLPAAGRIAGLSDVRPRALCARSPISNSPMWIRSTAHARRGPRGLRRPDPPDAALRPAEHSGTGRLRSSPASASATTTSTSAPARRAGIALVITPDGVRRPMAVTVLTLVLALASKLMAKDRLTRMGPEGWAQRSAHMGLGLPAVPWGSSASAISAPRSSASRRRSGCASSRTIPMPIRPRPGSLAPSSSTSRRCFGKPISCR